MTMGSLKQMLSLVSPDEFQALQEICEYNDITEEQLICNPESITNIELFMQGIPQISCMSFFPHLVSLSLIQQNISSIEGLHNCPSLRVLHLCENVIERLDGLQNCSGLVELYLHSNKIKHIKNLSHLTVLEVLWLANNNIRKVEGLKDCVHLKELNLANNPINQVGDISNLKSLLKLNLAATNIGSFKEITKLSKLKALKDLRFLDLQWGKSPLALLHNYQTYTLFRIPGLQILDAEPVTEEQKQSAKTTYTRKRVYYNMCIKALRRKRNDICSMPSIKELKHINGLKRKFSELVKTQKDLELEICKQFENKTLNQEKANEISLSIEEKAVSLGHQLGTVMKQIDNLREELRAHKARQQKSIDLSIHWLLVELDTGGNVRMEAGSVEQSWFKNCVQLITSRFSTADFAPFGIIGVRARKVYRVHNRFLQDRFDRSAETKTRKKHVEHLLYGETFHGQDELQSIVEEGFPFIPKQSKSSHDPPVLLSNSIGLADVCRLQVVYDQLQQSNFSKIKATGWVLIVKAYLGLSVQDNQVGNEFVNVNRSSYPDADSVYRIHPSDPTQKSWYIFDSSMLVPEYLVEYEYVFMNDNPSNQADSCKTKENLANCYLAPKTDRSLGNGICILPTTNHLLMELGDASGSGMSDREEMNEVVSICNHSSILDRNSQVNFSRVTHLNLHNSCISVLQPLRGLSNLKVLILSFNKISRIGLELQGLEKLEVLDLSFNILKQVNGLYYLKRLVTLDLAGNQISAMEDLQHLLLQVPHLLCLNLRGNPVEESKGYKELLRKSLPSLTELDCTPIDVDVNESDKETVSGKESSRTEDGNIGLLEHFRTREQNGITYDGDIEELHLEHQLLKSMSSISKQPNLRRLILSGNEISTIEGLEMWPLLEELILEDNCINQIKQTGPLPTLWKLDLGRNEITSCNQICNFTSLTQLSIERNKVQSLKGLDNLTNLMELYAAYNLLTDVSEIVHIRTLPKLMVVDLSGNPLCEKTDYRSYTIFSLRKLKVFDGKVVDTEELNEARDKHIGRLTKDMLEDFLGTSEFEGIKTLNLSGKGLRHCGNVFESEDFLGLRELDVSNNFLSSVQPLRSLLGLHKLLVHNNNIEDGPLLGSITIYSDDDLASKRADKENARPSSTGAILNVRGLGKKLCFHTLEILQLDRNSINSIASLKLQQYSPKLKVLSLRSNTINKIDGLNGLVFLQKLLLDHNCIKEMEASSFENLPNLEELHLSDNLIKSVQHLGCLTSLQTLNLGSNYIKQDRSGGFPVVKELMHLNRLQDLNLSENPICRHPHYRCAVIGKLGSLTILDGLAITEDEILDAEAYMTGKVRDERSPEAENETHHQMENVGNQNIINGKVALKAKPFNFEAMPLSPKVFTPGDYGNVGNVTPVNSRMKHEGENRSIIPASLMNKFRRVKEKPV